MSFFTASERSARRMRMNALAERDFRPAKRPDTGIKLLNQKYFFRYDLKKPDAMLREVQQYGVDFRNPFNLTPLMIVARLGNADHVHRLVETGAETSLVNSVGFNAFQIGLEQACIAPHYATRKLPGVYAKLEPQDMVIQVDGRLDKLDRRLMEFLMLNLMIAMFYIRLGENVVRFRGGATQCLTLPLAQSAWQLRQTSAQVVAEIDALLDHHTEARIADMLNKRGLVSGEGRSFHASTVQRIRRSYTQQQRLGATGSRRRNLRR